MSLLKNELASLEVQYGQATKQIGELLIEYLHSNEPLAVALRAHLTGEMNDGHRTETMPDRPDAEDMTDVSDWLDGATAEDMLGVSTRTLQHYRDTGMLPYSKVGNKIYYKRSDLGAMIERHYKKGDAESERNCQKGNAESERNYQKGGQR